MSIRMTSPRFAQTPTGEIKFLGQPDAENQIGLGTAGAGSVNKAYPPALGPSTTFFVSGWGQATDVRSAER